MLKIVISSISICLLLFLNSCNHKTDLSSLKDVTFSSDIQPIMAGNCTQSGCHNDKGDARFPLVTYDDVIKHGGIKAGDAHGSKMYQAVSNHGNENAMPPSPLPLLSDDQIKTIYIWIEQGAKNN